MVDFVLFTFFALVGPLLVALQSLGALRISLAPLCLVSCPLALLSAINNANYYFIGGPGRQWNISKMHCLHSILASLTFLTSLGSSITVLQVLFSYKNTWKSFASGIVGMHFDHDHSLLKSANWPCLDHE